MRRDVRQRFLQAGLARIPESEIPLDDLEDSELATFFETYGLLHPHRLHLPRGAGPRTIGALRRSGLLKDVTVLNLADAQLDLAPLRDLLWLACRGELVRLEFNGAGLDNALEEALLEISAEQIVVVDGYLSPDIRVRLEERFGSQLQLGPG